MRGVIVFMTLTTAALGGCATTTPWDVSRDYGECFTNPTNVLHGGQWQVAVDGIDPSPRPYYVVVKVFVTNPGGTGPIELVLQPSEDVLVAPKGTTSVAKAGGDDCHKWGIRLAPSKS